MHFTNVCFPSLTIGAAVRVSGTWTRCSGPKHTQPYELQAEKVEVLGRSDASVCFDYLTAWRLPPSIAVSLHHQQT